MPRSRPSASVERLAQETERQLAWVERFAALHAGLAARCEGATPEVDDVVALLDAAVAGLRAQAELLSRQADVTVAMHDELQDLRLAVREVLVAGLPAIAGARRSGHADADTVVLPDPRALSFA
jgi:hypothetical protein